MIPKFFEVSKTGSTSSAYNYLLGNRQRPYAPEVLTADKSCAIGKALCEKVANNGRKKQGKSTYTSGALSFEESALNISESVQQDVMRIYEESLMCGYYTDDEKAYHIDWIRHTDKDSKDGEVERRLELNLVVPLWNTLTDTSLTVRMHQQKIYNDLSEATRLLVNEVYGFSDPDHPSKRRLADNSPAQKDEASKALCERIDNEVQDAAMAGLVSSQDDVIDLIKSLKVRDKNGNDTDESLVSVAEKTTKKGLDGIHIRSEFSSKPINLKGAFYEKEFTNGRGIVQQQRELCRAYAQSRRGRIADAFTRVAELRSELTGQRVERMRKSRSTNKDAIRQHCDTVGDGVNTALNELKQRFERGDFDRSIDLREQLETAFWSDRVADFRPDLISARHAKWRSNGVEFDDAIIDKALEYQGVRVAQERVEEVGSRHSEKLSGSNARRIEKDNLTEEAINKRSGGNELASGGDAQVPTPDVTHNRADEQRLQNEADLGDEFDSYVPNEQCNNVFCTENNSSYAATDREIDRREHPSSEFGFLSSSEPSEQLRAALESDIQAIQVLAESYGTALNAGDVAKTKRVWAKQDRKGRKHLVLTANDGSSHKFLDSGNKVTFKDQPNTPAELKEQIQQSIVLAKAKGWKLETLSPNGSDEFKQAFKSAIKEELSKELINKNNNNNEQQSINRSTTTTAERDERPKPISTVDAGATGEDFRRASADNKKFADKLERYINLREQRAERFSQSCTALNANIKNITDVSAERAGACNEEDVRVCGIRGLDHLTREEACRELRDGADHLAELVIDNRCIADINIKLDDSRKDTLKEELSKKGTAIKRPKL
ncbi:hypothetical protein ACPV5R_18675 [Vibrio astriarenae]